MDLKKGLLAAFMAIVFISNGNTLTLLVPSCQQPERQDGNLVYGRFGSVVPIKNKSTMNSKDFKGIKASRYFWKEKYQIKIAADSSFGVSPDSSALIIYAGEYQALYTSEPEYSMDLLKHKLEKQTVFKFDKYQGEYVLINSWERPEPPCEEDTLKAMIEKRLIRRQ